MITIEELKKYKKEELVEVSEKLSKEDIKKLVELLNEKDDKVRYPSFLILQYRSQAKNDVYPYWDTFAGKLKSDNSYQRTIGVILIAENVKWDKDNKFAKIIDDYLEFCNDEKLIVARQCIQKLEYVIKGTDYDKKICDKIVNYLISINILKRSNTNWKVMTTDVVNILMLIQREIDYKEIINYLNKVLEGSLIDNKLKKEIQELLN
jgi:hypothetical protein